MLDHGICRFSHDCSIKFEGNGWIARGYLLCYLMFTFYIFALTFDFSYFVVVCGGSRNAC